RSQRNLARDRHAGNRRSQLGTRLAAGRRLVQVDHGLRVETEILGVGAQEPACVHGWRQRCSILGFERLQVTASNAGVARRVRERDTFVETRLAQGLTECPHGASLPLFYVADYIRPRNREQPRLSPPSARATRHEALQAAAY